MTSPYKKIRSANKEWIPYTQIRQLEKNKPYKVENIVATSHPQYGEGQSATLKHPLGTRFRVQLPKKYLASFSKEDLNMIKTDVVINGKTVFLVFREIMNDNSYRIDITEASEEWIENFNKNQEVNELQDSIHEEEENGPSNQDDKQSNEGSLEEFNVDGPKDKLEDKPVDEHSSKRKHE